MQSIVKPNLKCCIFTIFNWLFICYCSLTWKWKKKINHGWNTKRLERIEQSVFFQRTWSNTLTKLRTMIRKRNGYEYDTNTKLTVTHVQCQIRREKTRTASWIVIGQIELGRVNWGFTLRLRLVFIVISCF